MLPKYVQITFFYKKYNLNIFKYNIWSKILLLFLNLKIYVILKLFKTFL